MWKLWLGVSWEEHDPLKWTNHAEDDQTLPGTNESWRKVSASDNRMQTTSSTLLNSCIFLKSWTCNPVCLCCDTSKIPEVAIFPFAPIPLQQERRSWSKDLKAVFPRRTTGNPIADCFAFKAPKTLTKNMTWWIRIWPLVPFQAWTQS